MHALAEHMTLAGLYRLADLCILTELHALAEPFAWQNTCA